MLVLKSDALNVNLVNVNAILTLAMYIQPGSQADMSDATVRLRFMISTPSFKSTAYAQDWICELTYTMAVYNKIMNQQTLTSEETAALQTQIYETIANPDYDSEDPDSIASFQYLKFTALSNSNS